MLLISHSKSCQFHCAAPSASLPANRKSGLKVVLVSSMFTFISRGASVLLSCLAGNHGSGFDFCLSSLSLLATMGKKIGTTCLCTPVDGICVETLWGKGWITPPPVPQPWPWCPHSCFYRPVRRNAFMQSWHYILFVARSHFHFDIDAQCFFPSSFQLFMSHLGCVASTWLCCCSRK